MLLKFITILWLLFMLILSHIPGEPSGAESRWLSSMTGVEEGLLRRSMHVVLYMILAVLVMMAWPETGMWVRAVVLTLVAVIDEASKALPVFRGRHCSVVEIGLNLVGVGIGVCVGVGIGTVIGLLVQ